MDLIVDAAIVFGLISLGVWLVAMSMCRELGATDSDESPKQVPPIKSETCAENCHPRRAKVSPITRTDGAYPDSCDLTLIAWRINPIRLSKPAKTPLGGRPTVLWADVDVRFRVRKNTLEIISGWLSHSSEFYGLKSNVAAVRRGETWLADASLEMEINKKLPHALEAELKNESQFRRALWGRYFDWTRNEKS